ncbi:MAG: hypothetical protein JNL73_03795 [Anaerolineales bacterium]|nr:hypothetical protein [Anaerolineales bacterium]
MANTVVRDRAIQRVETNPALRGVKKVLLEPQPDPDKHYAWLATAPISDLVAWAQKKRLERGEQF